MNRENKSKLEKKIREGLYGKPEIKKEEKNRFLGEYKERVLKYLTYDQVMGKGSYDEILEAIKRPEAKKVIINRNLDIDYAHDYIKLARENNLKFKRIDSPDFTGDVALVVVSNQAVNTEKRDIMAGE